MVNLLYALGVAVRALRTTFTCGRRAATIAVSLLVALLACIAPGAPSARAVQTIGVGECDELSFKAAVALAMATDGIVQFTTSCSGVDAILFTSSADATYIGGATTLEIDANGNEVELDGQGTDRILYVPLDAGADVNLHLKGLTLMNAFGDAGATIRNEDSGTVTIDDSVIKDAIGTSVGGGVWSLGPLIVNRSRFERNSSLASGGAIFSDGNVTITDSTFANNAAAAGATAISVDADLTIDGSTFSGHLSTAGPTIRAVDGNVAIVNTTVTGNSTTAGEAAVSIDIGGAETAHITNSTITDNGEFGVVLTNDGTLFLRNSIVHGHSVADVALAGGTFAISLNNLFSILPVGMVVDVGNIIAASHGLGPLADNGGPVFTQAVPSTSLAFHNGDGTTCTNTTGPIDFGAGSQDARDKIRTLTHCTIGAFEPTANITVGKSQLVPGDVAVGGTVTYIITATNNGPDDATTVKISETMTLPAGVTVTSVVPSSGTYLPPNSAAGTWTLDLADGAFATLTVTLAVGASTAGGSTISNSVAFVSLDQSQDGIPGSVTVNTPVVRLSDLVVRKLNVGTGLVTPGAIVSYIIQVENLGPSPANAASLSVVDTLPPGFKNVVFAPSPAPWACVVTLPTFTCTRTGTTMPVGVEEIRFSVTSSPSAVAATPFMNHARVIVTPSANQEGDPDPATNAAAAIRVAGPPVADLRIYKAIKPIIPAPGQVVNYRVRIHNSGPSNASGVVMKDQLPAGYVFKGWVGPNPGCLAVALNAVAPLLQCNLATLPVGGSVTYSFDAQLPLAPDGRIRNVAKVESTSLDPDLTNNSAVEAATLQ